MAMSGFVFPCTCNLITEFTIAFVSSPVAGMRSHLGMARRGSVRNAGVPTQDQLLQTVYGDGAKLILKTSKTK